MQASQRKASRQEEIHWVEGDAPTPNQRVMVTTENFRCLGFIDTKGIWRQSFSGEPLKHVLGWEAIDTVNKS